MLSSWGASASSSLAATALLLAHLAGCAALQLDEASTLNRQALESNRAGKTDDALALAKRALELREKAEPPDPAATIKALDALAGLHRQHERRVEAEQLYKRAIELREKTLPADHPDIAQSLNNLAYVYWEQGRSGEAEPLADRALAIHEKTLTANHPETASSLNFRAMLHHTQDRLDEAERLYNRALAIREKAQPPNPLAVASSLNNLATLRQKQGRFDDATVLHRRALAIQEKTLPASHPDIAASLNNLAYCHMQQRHYADAEPLFKRVLATSEQTLPAGHPEFVRILANLSDLYYFQKRWREALDYQSRATKLLIQYGNSESAALAASLSAKGQKELTLNPRHFLHHVRAAFRVAADDPRQTAELREESFRLGQLAGRTAAARALSRMAARLRAGDKDLANLARERQDLEAQWQAADAQLSAALQKSVEQRAGADDGARRRIRELNVRITDIDTRFKKDFPDYHALASPEPLSIAEVRKLLHPNEALLFFPFLDLPQWRGFSAESFAWVVTKTEVRWVKLSLAPNAITEQVQVLRCGLDATAWSTKTQAKRCRTLLKAEPIEDVLPFDLGVAHKLYQSLLGSFAKLIEGKHLLIVPSGALGSLPFQVLVKEKPEVARPDATGYQAAVWLGTQHPITVLPAVSSLAALRGVPKQASAGEEYLGFGNPVLDGGAYCERITVPSDCPEIAPTRAIAARGAVRRAASRVTEKFHSGGQIGVRDVKKICPLPDTAFEIKCVARSLGASEKQIHVGPAATESEVKRMSRAGLLARARIVHFATHGLLPGNESYLEKALAEPALVLTPPKAATDEDDGLLTAPEIATLKLNADWVILSACNTAGGVRLGTEALSGLSRAFLHAGARALLVSHWEVYSDAAVQLTTKAFAELKSNPRIGRAEAVRRSMQRVISAGGFAAHPAYWAPFVVVGEGGQ